MPAVIASPRRSLGSSLPGSSATTATSGAGTSSCPESSAFLQVAEKPPVHGGAATHHQDPGGGDRAARSVGRRRDRRLDHLPVVAERGEQLLVEQPVVRDRTGPRGPPGTARARRPAGRSRSAGAPGACRSPSVVLFEHASGTTEIAPVSASKESWTWVVTKGCTIRSPPVIQLRMPLPQTSSIIAESRCSRWRSSKRSSYRARARRAGSALDCPLPPRPAYVRFELSLEVFQLFVLSIEDLADVVEKGWLALGVGRPRPRGTARARDGTGGGGGTEVLDTRSHGSSPVAVTTHAGCDGMSAAHQRLSRYSAMSRIGCSRRARTASRYSTRRIARGRMAGSVRVKGASTPADCACPPVVKAANAINPSWRTRSRLKARRRLRHSIRVTASHLPGHTAGEKWQVKAEHATVRAIDFDLLAFRQVNSPA